MSNPGAKSSKLLIGATAVSAGSESDGSWLPSYSILLPGERLMVNGSWLMAPEGGLFDLACLV